MSKQENQFSNINSIEFDKLLKEFALSFFQGLSLEELDIGTLLEKIDEASQKTGDKLDEFSNYLSSTNDIPYVIITCLNQLDKTANTFLTHFLKEGKTTEKLLRGPLGSMMVRIRLLYSLGYIDKEILNCFEILTKIRNNFAHNLGESKKSLITYREDLARLATIVGKSNFFRELLISEDDALYSTDFNVHDYDHNVMKILKDGGLPAYKWYIYFTFLELEDPKNIDFLAGLADEKLKDNLLASFIVNCTLTLEVVLQATIALLPYSKNNLLESPITIGFANVPNLEKYSIFTKNYKVLEEYRNENLHSSINRKERRKAKRKQPKK